MTKEEWAENMQNDEVYCDDIFLYNAAHILSRDIHILPVFRQVGNQDGWIVIESNSTSKLPPLHVLYYSDQMFNNPHYQSIRPIIYEEPEFEN